MMTMDKASVSVVIVNWNSSELLLRCLAALERQTYPIAETIVIDNGSTRPPLPEMGERFPGLRVIRLERNTGFAAANNHAVHHSGHSEWIALLNPDAFPKPDWLEQLMRATRSFPDYASFGSRMLMADDPKVLDGTGDSYHVSGLVWRQNHGCPATENPGEYTEIFSPCAAAALYRRDAFLSVGGFDEDYFCYIEDVDLGFRLRLANHRCARRHGPPCRLSQHCKTQRLLCLPWAAQPRMDLREGYASPTILGLPAAAPAAKLDRPLAVFRQRTGEDDFSGEMGRFARFAAHSEKAKSRASHPHGGRMAIEEDAGNRMADEASM